MECVAAATPASVGWESYKSLAVMRRMRVTFLRPAIHALCFACAVIAAWPVKHANFAAKHYDVPFAVTPFRLRCSGWFRARDATHQV